jgi:cell division protein FtsB
MALLASTRKINEINGMYIPNWYIEGIPRRCSKILLYRRKTSPIKSILIKLLMLTNLSWRFRFLNKKIAMTAKIREAQTRISNGEVSQKKIMPGRSA